jgi:hypothetical protein
MSATTTLDAGAEVAEMAADVRQLASVNRYREIMGAPEARGLQPLAYGLAATVLPVDQCRALLELARPHEGQRRFAADVKRALDSDLETAVAALNRLDRRGR